MKQTNLLTFQVAIGIVLARGVSADELRVPEQHPTVQAAIDAADGRRLDFPADDN